MKRYVLVTAILGIVIGASSFTFKEGQLELIVKSERTSYMLGELTQFEFKLKNMSNQDLVILNGLRNLDGYLSVWISKDGKVFEKYDHTKWGTVDSLRVTTLKPNQSAINKAVVFWNSKPKISSSIASDIAERASSGRILTDYAFPESGTYYIKASYSIHLSGQTEGLRIESSPVKIRVTEPTGKDLEVWKRIKDSGDIAYFIQEGDIPISSYKTEQRSLLRREIEEIIEQYPGLLITNQMEKSLQTLRTTEEKIKTATERLRLPK